MQQNAAQHESAHIQPDIMSAAARALSPTAALSTTAVKSKADHFMELSKKYEQESRGCRVSERASSGGPTTTHLSNGGGPTKPLRGLQSRIAASNKKATQKEILSLKALERALELKVSVLHQTLSEQQGTMASELPSASTIPSSESATRVETANSSRPSSSLLKRSRVNYLENMISPHLEIARLVESIVIKYNSVAVQWLKAAPEGRGGAETDLAKSPGSSSSLKSDTQPQSDTSDPSVPGIDDALGMLLEAAKFLQPPILQLLEYEKAAAKHVHSSISSLETDKEAIVSQFATNRLKSRMVFDDEDQRDMMMFMEADVKRPVGAITPQMDVNEDGLTNEDKKDMATLANAMPIPDIAKQNSLIHGAGVRFRKLYKIVADNEEALFREMMTSRDGDHSSSVNPSDSLRPPTALSLVVSQAEVATVIGQEAANTAWFDKPDLSSTMGAYLCNKTSQVELNKALRRLQSMDLSQLYLLGLKHDDPTLISTFLDKRSNNNVNLKAAETNTTSSMPPPPQPHRGGGGVSGSSMGQSESYESKLFRALGVFMSPGEKGPFVNPVAMSNLYFTFPMLHNACGPGNEADDVELAEISIAVSRIVGSVLLRLRATTLNNIACVLRRKGEIQQAISFVHASIQLEERGHLLTSVLGSSHIFNTADAQRKKRRDSDNKKDLVSHLVVDVSPHDPTVFLSSVLLSQLAGGGGGTSVSPDAEALWGQSSSIASITNLSAMYGQIGRYQEATTHARKAVILYQQQNVNLLQNPPGTEASTIFPISSSGTNGNPFGIANSLLEGGRPPSRNEPNTSQGKRPSKTMIGLGAVVYHNLAMALEPSDPDGCVQAYNTALRLAIDDLGGEWSPASTAIKTNRTRYLQWLDRRRGVAKLIQTATPQPLIGNKNRSRSSSPIGASSKDLLSPRPPSGRNAPSRRPTSSRVLGSQHQLASRRSSRRGSSAPPVSSGPNVLVRNIDGGLSFDFSEVKDSDYLLLSKEDDVDNVDLVTEVVAPFLNIESALSLPDLHRLRVLNAKIQSQLRDTGVVDLDTIESLSIKRTGSNKKETPNNRSISPAHPNISVLDRNGVPSTIQQHPPRPSSVLFASQPLCEGSEFQTTFKSAQKPPLVPQPPSGGPTSSEAAHSQRKLSSSVGSRPIDPSDQPLREPAFSLLIETQTSLLRAGDLLNSELAKNLMVSTLANINNGRSTPQPPPKQSPGRLSKTRFSRGPLPPRGSPQRTNISPRRPDPSRRGRYGEDSDDLQENASHSYIKEPKAPQALPKEFFNEVRKGDELVQFFATRLNNLLKIEEVVESRYAHAMTIQCAWRSNRARYRFDRQRKYRNSKSLRLVARELKATRTITTFLRNLADRRRRIDKEKNDAAREKLQRLLATIVFQKFTRKWLANEHVHRLRRRRDRFLKAVFETQKQAKKWLAIQCRKRAQIAAEECKRMQRTNEKQSFAATKIQACFRSYWARIAVCYMKGDRKGAMIRNRRAYRNWAASLLQRNVRGYLVRKVTHQVLTDRRTVRQNKARTSLRLGAALKISSLWRGFYVRKFEQKDLRYRMKQARNIRIFGYQVQAALVLQRAIRCMLSKIELQRLKDRRSVIFEASRGVSYEVVPIPLSALMVEQRSTVLLN